MIKLWLWWSKSARSIWRIAAVTEDISKWHGVARTTNDRIEEGYFLTAEELESLKQEIWDAARACDVCSMSGEVTQTYRTLTDYEREKLSAEIDYLKDK